MKILFAIVPKDYPDIDCIVKITGSMLIFDTIEAATKTLNLCFINKEKYSIIELEVTINENP